ncbi:hypothetical protein [Janibacter terrae]|uniref:hypothetical protein n=1 Tax=Janibacter terrae TaxID=103817 RepID=UPI0031FA0C51
MSTTITTNSAFAKDPIGGEPTERVSSVEGFCILHGVPHVDVIFPPDRFNTRPRTARVPLSSLAVVAVAR